LPPESGQNIEVRTSAPIHFIGTNIAQYLACTFRKKPALGLDLTAYYTPEKMDENPPNHARPNAIMIPPVRKLVSLRRISQVLPLESSETHELVMVGGWPVVVQKEEFVVNQRILYIGIESWLPSDIEYGRLTPYRSSLIYAALHGQLGWVVQTCILNGHISQGMVFSMDHF
jgi:hypothetical protein